MNLKHQFVNLIVITLHPITHHSYHQHQVKQQLETMKQCQTHQRALKAKR